MSNETRYPIPDNPNYNNQIRRILNSDPVNAAQILNPVLIQMIANSEALFLQKADMRLGETVDEVHALSFFVQIVGAVDKGYRVLLTDLSDPSKEFYPKTLAEQVVVTTEDGEEKSLPEIIAEVGGVIVQETPPEPNPSNATKLWIRLPDGSAHYWHNNAWTAVRSLWA